MLIDTNVSNCVFCSICEVGKQLFGLTCEVDKICQHMIYMVETRTVSLYLHKKFVFDWNMLVV